MLELAIVFLIGKQFYDLAKKYKQNLSWVYFIVGIVAYYGGAFIGGILLGLYGNLMGFDPLLELNNFQLILIFLPFAALCCWGTYQLLKKKWHKDFLAKEESKPKISDIGKSEDEIQSEQDSR